jgi:anti-anti-sigma factor
MAPPGVLDVSIRRRDHVVELGLAGDLDLATAHRLREAMTWLRFTLDRDQTIVIDTRALDFVAVAGYRALRAELVGPDGVPDRSVVCITGPVITRFESALGTALASGVSRIPHASRASRAAARCSPAPQLPGRPRADRDPRPPPDPVARPQVNTRGARSSKPSQPSPAGRRKSA